MSLQYIVDGYNVIKHPLFSRRHRKINNSQLAFLRFIITERLTGSRKNKVTVVFDGFSSEAQKIQSSSEIDVIFARNESADEKIREIIERAANVKNIVVVSDDKEIKFFAKSCGGRTATVEEFLAPSKKIEEKEEEIVKPELSYSQMHKINQELKKVWLK